MKNPLGALTRLFNREETPHAVIAALYTHAIGQPLLVHPAMGEQLIAGYMQGGIEAAAHWLKGTFPTRARVRSPSSTSAADWSRGLSRACVVTARRTTRACGMLSTKP